MIEDSRYYDEYDTETDDVPTSGLGTKNDCASKTDAECGEETGSDAACADRVAWGNGDSSIFSRMQKLFECKSRRIRMPPPGFEPGTARSSVECSPSLS